MVVPSQPVYNRLSRGKGRGDRSSYVRGASSIFAPHSWEFRSTKYRKPYPRHHAFSPPNPSLESLLYIGIETRMFIQASWEVNMDLGEASYLFGKVHGCPLVISYSIHALYWVMKSNPSLLEGSTGKQQELSTGCLWCHLAFPLLLNPHFKKKRFTASKPHLRHGCSFSLIIWVLMGSLSLLQWSSCWGGCLGILLGYIHLSCCFSRVCFYHLRYPLPFQTSQ